jgi:hypothetical protein
VFPCHPRCFFSLDEVFFDLDGVKCKLCVILMQEIEIETEIHIIVHQRPNRSKGLEYTSHGKPIQNFGGWLSKLEPVTKREGSRADLTCCLNQ